MLYSSTDRAPKPTSLLFHYSAQIMPQNASACWQYIISKIAYSARTAGRIYSSLAPATPTRTRDLQTTIYSYKLNTNEDKTFPFCMTPLFRVHLVLFFRVTEKPLQASYYKIQIVVYFYIHTRKAVTFAY